MVTADQWAQLIGDEVDPFDSARSDLKWREKDIQVGLLDDAGRLVAAAELATAELAGADGQRTGVVGIGGVIVAAPCRGRGLARRVVELALERAGTLGPGLAMLFCYRDRAGLYERLGFHEVEAEVWVEQPSGSIRMPLVTMWRALLPGASPPAGPLTLDGLPF